MSGEAIRLERDAAGIAWVVFDDPSAKVNIFTAGTVALLDRILDELIGNKPAGVIFISGKPNAFIAGADIHEIAKIRDAAYATELSRSGHRLFAKIENLGVPTVAAIDGACLGGGCEMALACRSRVATDNPKTEIGLPETQLGIIPGWGGTQRLPALIGLRAALEIIVPGKTLDAKRALKVGLVDAVVPVLALRAAAVKALGIERRRVRSSWWPDFIIQTISQRRSLAQTHGQYPAPLKAIEVAGRGYDAEARAVGEMVATPVSQNLIRVYLLREKYSKLQIERAARREPRPPIRKVGVLGAGVMGAGIAQWCSACGLMVRLRDIQPEFVAAGMQRIAAIYREGVQRQRLTELTAQQGLARVHPTTDFSGFQDCELVIEAVVEKLEVKRAALAELPARGIIASNTSAIPIGDLASVTGRPEQFIGIHFFNPVHQMPLVEIVRGEQTADETVAVAVEFAKQLKKIPVVVKSAPGFVVNRILLPYLNEAGKLLGEGIDLAYIDNAMVLFGWPMGPLRLIDEVGIDVAFAVARELAEAFHGRMPVAPILEQLHNAGLKGRKGGRGFYAYAGKKEQPEPQFKGRAMDANAIQDRLMGVMVAEAKEVLRAGIVASEDDIDVAMIFGTGFPPFRGGLVKWARDTGVW
ncbi:MAG: 3-hydroxyacyl-CoA dehydrogenase NAD-binding domain-containing protein [Verrucomicrobiota bacterium]